MPKIDSFLAVTGLYRESGKAAVVGVRVACDGCVVLGVCGGYIDGVIAAVAG